MGFFFQLAVSSDWLVLYFFLCFDVRKNIYLHDYLKPYHDIGPSAIGLWFYLNHDLVSFRNLAIMGSYIPESPWIFCSDLTTPGLDCAFIYSSISLYYERSSVSVSMSPVCCSQRITLFVIAVRLCRILQSLL